MIRLRTLSVLSTLMILVGCTSPQGCSGLACKRPDSSSRDLVIWWPEKMRQGLNEQDRNRDRDYSVIPLED